MVIGIVDFPGSSCNDVVLGLKESFSLDTEVISRDETDLSKYEIIIIPGGFSYGDYLRPGAIAAQTNFSQALIKVAEQGCRIIGIGNGFQILTELGLLPGMFLKNKNLKFVCKFTDFTVENNQSFATSNFKEKAVVSLPVSHEYGNYFCDEETLVDIEKNKQILLTYKDNFNGSRGDIAGLVNKEGNVIGLMAHPERALEKIQASDSGRIFFESLIGSRREEDASK